MDEVDDLLGKDEYAAAMRQICEEYISINSAFIEGTDIVFTEAERERRKLLMARASFISTRLSRFQPLS